MTTRRDALKRIGALLGIAAVPSVVQAQTPKYAISHKITEAYNFDSGEIDFEGGTWVPASVDGQAFWLPLPDLGAV